MYRLSLTCMVLAFSAALVIGAGEAAADCVGGSPNGVLEAGEACDNGPGADPSGCCNTSCHCDAGVVNGCGPLCSIGTTCQQQGVVFGGNSCPCALDPACPLGEGFYSITQLSGGTLKTGSLPAFPFPSGGQILLDVGPSIPAGLCTAPPASVGNVCNLDADCDVVPMDGVCALDNSGCVHTVQVPFPGGNTVPVFCIPGLSFTTSVTQTGCGGGLLDSDGGSDFTVSEVGDTSIKVGGPGPCEGLVGDQTFLCFQGDDSEIRVDVTRGDGVPDTCASGGTANLLVSIPVFTRTWLEFSSQTGCTLGSVGDGTFDPGSGDALIVEFPQNLDQTTDTGTAKFFDIDGDGCSRAGLFPNNVGGTGACLDYPTGTLTTVATGPIGSAGSPLFDLVFISTLPSSFSVAGPSPGTPVCGALLPPGLSTRCIVE